MVETFLLTDSVRKMMRKEYSLKCNIFLNLILLWFVLHNLLFCCCWCCCFLLLFSKDPVRVSGVFEEILSSHGITGSRTLTLTLTVSEDHLQSVRRILTSSIYCTYDYRGAVLFISPAICPRHSTGDPLKQRSLKRTHNSVWNHFALSATETGNLIFYCVLMLEDVYSFSHSHTLICMANEINCNAKCTANKI